MSDSDSTRLSWTQFGLGHVIAIALAIAVYMGRRWHERWARSIYSSIDDVWLLDRLHKGALTNVPWHERSLLRLYSTYNYFPSGRPKTYNEERAKQMLALVELITTKREEEKKKKRNRDKVASIVSEAQSVP